MTDTIKVFVPGFPGFASPEWAPLLSEPRWRAARLYAGTEGGERPRLDEGEYLELLQAASDQTAQRSTIARTYIDMFGTHLAIRLGIPHGLRFSRYDGETDRIEASIPLGAVRWILEHGKAGGEGPPEGVAPEDQEALIDHVPGDVPSEAAARAIRLLDGAALGGLLGEFVDPGFAKTAPRVIARRRAELAFSHSLDWPKLQSAILVRRREKRRQLSGEAFDVASSPPSPPG